MAFDGGAFDSGAFDVVTAGGTATLLGVEVLTLSTTNPTPGAQNVTVPSGTQGVVVMARANSPSLTLTSSFAGTWTNVPPSSGVERLQYAPVSATGAQTITPNWGAFIVEGPVFFIFYIGNIDNSAPANWVRDAATGEVNTQTIDSETADLVLGLDSAVTTTAAIPGNETGWTSLATQANGNLSGRARQADSPGSPTTTMNRQRNGTATDFHGLGMISIIGASGGGAFGVEPVPGVYSLTGSSATTLRTARLETTPGSYAVTGLSATTLVRPRLETTPGGYAITGQPVTLLAADLLETTPGAYSVTGQSATTLWALRLETTSGSYSITGVDADLTVGAGAAGIEPIPGSYAVTGDSATALWTHRADTTPGAYAITGQPVTVNFARLVATTPGSYSVVGQPATTLFNRRTDANAGAYVVTGVDADLTPQVNNPAIETIPGVYSITGFAAETIGPSGFADTHDGFWAKQYRKMWEYKKPTIAEIVEAIEEAPEEVIEALPEVEQEIHREYGRVDYSEVAQNAQMIEFVAKQIQIALELRRIELDEEDAEILLLM